MATCARCNRELTEGEEFGVVRIQLWKTTVGSGECKGPDQDVTRNYCVECSRTAPLGVWE